MSWLDDAWDWTAQAGGTLWDYITDIDTTDPNNTGLMKDIGSFFGVISNDGSLDWSKVLALGVSAYGTKQGWFDPNIEKVGYQGKIPDYTAVRNRLDVDTSEAARPAGAAGRRYFTDMQYAKTPEGKEAPTLEEAQGIANLQQQQMEQAQGMATGGLASLKKPKGKYLRGDTDGMADEIPARIDGEQEARLSDGEFVIPADVVSHLGNGNSDAGAKKLEQMMSQIRKARTGSPKQGKQINPDKFMPV